MPNHCSNDLFIQCSNTEQAKEFLKEFFLIEKLPEEGMELTEECRKVINEVEINGRRWDLCHIIEPYPEHFAKRDKIRGKYGHFPTQEQILEMYKDLGEEPQYYDNGNIKSPSDGFNTGGYEWCCNTWGTKWGTYDIVVKNVDFMTACDYFTMSLTFDTAWSPISGNLLEKFSKKYPAFKISMYSYEQGMGFICGVLYKNGVCEEEWSHKYYGDRGG